VAVTVVFETEDEDNVFANQIMTLLVNSGYSTTLYGYKVKPVKVITSIGNRQCSVEWTDRDGTRYSCSLWMPHAQHHWLPSV
jgi:hypothetical protein